MPISASSLEGLIRGNLSGAGFVLGGDHAKVGIAAKAVAVGVVGEVLATGKVIVPPHAGGTYSVTGLSGSGMSAKIRASLAGQGIVFGAHAQAHVLHNAIANAVTAQVLAKCSVSIPYDGSGMFQIVGLSQGALESLLISELQGAGFNTSAGDSDRFANAVAKAVTTEINNSAVVSGDFSGGGTFSVS
jgi:hypothetical protein